MTDLECGNCGSLTEKVWDKTWFDGHTVCKVTVGCGECGSETVYEFIEPQELRVYENE